MRDMLLGRMKTLIESMVKGNVKNESPMCERGLKERNHILRECEKTLRKAM
jgi:hypothetical protein